MSIRIAQRNNIANQIYQFNPQRNSVSLGIRMRWGMRNGIFHVAKEEGSDKVLGVAMWLRPQPADQPATWNDWLESWRLYFGQVWMNLVYGRGGLNVTVSRNPSSTFSHAYDLYRDTTSGKTRRPKPSQRFGLILEAITSSISWLCCPKPKERALEQR